MKTTKKQLRRIIREAIFLKEIGRHDPDSGYDELRQDRDDQEWEDREYQRGYQDALDLVPMADDATASYDSGYEDGTNDADQKAAEEILSTRMGSYRGTTLPGGKKI